MKTYAEILSKLKQLENDYWRELKNGSEEHASDKAKELSGQIYAIKWVLSMI